MSSKQYLKEFRNKQQIKHDQINYLLADVEENPRRIQKRTRTKKKAAVGSKKNTYLCKAKLR